MFASETSPELLSAQGPKELDSVCCADQIKGRMCALETLVKIEATAEMI